MIHLHTIFTISNRYHPYI